MFAFKRYILAFLLFNYTFSYALNGRGNLDRNVANGLNTAQTYLTYSMWAACVLGILAIGFMLFANIQDTLLRHLSRGFAICGIVAMAYFVPGWFGILIHF
jgi:hypothetical protein